MIEWIIGILVAKWWMDKEEKKKNLNNIILSDIQEIEQTNCFGYIRNGESIEDLQ